MHGSQILYHWQTSRSETVQPKGGYWPKANTSTHLQCIWPQPKWHHQTKTTGDLIQIHGLRTMHVGLPLEGYGFVPPLGISPLARRIWEEGAVASLPRLLHSWGKKGKGCLVPSVVRAWSPEWHTSPGFTFSLSLTLRAPLPEEEYSPGSCPCPCLLGSLMASRSCADQRYH